MPALTGPQFKHLTEAILDGFDQPALRQMLVYDLNVQLDHIAGEGAFRHVAFQVVDWAGRMGLIPDLLSAMKNARPNNAVVQKAVVDLRAALGLTTATAGPPVAATAPTHPLHAYARGGMVTPDLVPLSFIPVFSQLYPSPELVFQAVAAANQFRRAADPVDSAVRTIELSEIPNASLAGANAAWTSILMQACRGGPRLVAALLLSAPADAFGDDRTRFLDSLPRAT